MTLSECLDELAKYKGRFRIDKSGRIRAKYMKDSTGAPACPLCYLAQKLVHKKYNNSFIALMGLSLELGSRDCVVIAEAADGVANSVYCGAVRIYLGAALGLH